MEKNRYSTKKLHSFHPLVGKKCGCIPHHRWSFQRGKESIAMPIQQKPMLTLLSNVLNGIKNIACLHTVCVASPKCPEDSAVTQLWRHYLVSSQNVSTVAPLVENKLSIFTWNTWTLLQRGGCRGDFGYIGVCYSLIIHLPVYFFTFMYVKCKDMFELNVFQFCLQKSKCVFLSEVEALLIRLQ